MKIVHITPSYKPAYIYGGPIFSIARLCEELSLTQLIVEVITTNANGSKMLKLPCNVPCEIDGVKVYYFKRIIKDHIQLSLSLLFHLHRTIQQPNIIVHIHSWWNLTAILSCLIARSYQIPVILSPRGMLSVYTRTYKHSFSKSMVHTLLGKKLLRYCHIHATSEAEKEEILNVCTPRSITVIPNLIYFPDESSYKPENHNHETEAPGVFKLLFLSRIDRKKGLDLLLTALAECSFPWYLTIAGPGDKKYIGNLQQLASRLNIADQIYWKGQIEPDYKYPLLCAHQLLVLFSHNENFSNVVLESLAAGTPVAISQHVGLSKYVIKNQLGWTSTLEKTDIIKTLEEAYKSNIQRELIRKEAPSIIKKDYRKSLVQKYIHLYKDLQ